MDDFKTFTGGGADLNGDGKVDFAEFENDFEGFNRSVGSTSPFNKSTKASGSGRSSGCGVVAALLCSFAFLCSMPFSAFSVIAAIIFFILLKLAFK